MSPERVVLPTNVSPVHYDLKLTPNLETFVLKGEAAITVAIHEPTCTIQVNAKALVVDRASVIIGNEIYKATSIESTASEVITVTFAQELPKGAALLDLEFTGELNDQMTGFYRSEYKDKDGKVKYMAVTQFESTMARQAFPCWDEPSCKATFSAALVVPKELTALSNTPVKEITDVGSDVKTVHFEKTPIMSTYLVAFAVGDFEYIETTTTKLETPVVCRVYTLPGLAEQGRFTLEITPKILEYFAEIFGIAYPLAKLDQIAVPDFESGGMENWGLIVYRTTALLYDPKTSAASDKEQVAYVVAHEIAHQWFGNLVTMEWWDHLWLNEGFATWVGTLAVDHLFPTWDTWSEFAIGECQIGMSLDSLRSSHPIEVQVTDPEDIDQIFDDISYSKGASVIRMLSTWLTIDVFLAGIRRYLLKHQYKNATTNDLWDALSEESKIDVGEFMNTWTRVIGIPILNVEEVDGLVKVEQHRFLSTNDATEDEDQTIWWIPMGIHPRPASIKDANQTLKTRSLTFEVPQIKDDESSFFLVNKDFSGVFHTNYSAESIHKIGRAILAGHPDLTVSDRAGLLADQSSLAKSGHGTVTRFLDLVQYYKNEKAFIVWNLLLEKLDNITQLFSTNGRTFEGIKHFQRELVDKLVHELGWEFPENEDFLTTRLRGAILATAGKSGHEATVKEGLRRFELFMQEGADQDAVLNPSTRRTAFEIALTHGGVKKFEQVLNYYRTTPKQDQQSMALVALGAAVHGQEMIQRVLELVLSSEVRSQDVSYVISGLAMNFEARHAAWNWIKANWTTLYERFKGSVDMLGFLVKIPVRCMADEAIIQDLTDFFADKDVKEFDRDLEQSKEAVGVRSKWVSRDGPALEAWLVENGH
ncbi:aminopeptidase 2 [Entomortierella parvispora]|uniref:Aminopeptidase n=1 Tax=Entomortierella parvispora TaxID=205924 RepID=A0A9P3M0R6_9FUNG|nr:aminopeptidase 2 [Entomortierella parvispora]